MKKRRSTVYVRPGKDVTLYIPAETPPEVIDYLNRLKAEGIFSQGVMDILAAHVQGRRDTARGHEHANPHADARFPASEPAAPMPADIEDFGADDELLEPATYRPPAAAWMEDWPDPEPSRPEPSRKLNMAQIFSLSRKNTGKLLDRRDDE
ncbi:hypothetical protein SD70_04085 [Gordoniibacillus kamchatkensis]|uniref:Uncharacterized protein n=1 Tax=Gordoniibacillus kamchatkensis TaxID=1590651 RepID=A0ABR5ALH4_9BACL|nr:hypothetical protein [Paenibacillus sp. VKM B-2647]KIL41811.1 hypothetical protein SD70_04085 [Paenibacillus sp. VKM B-2647]